MHVKFNAHSLCHTIHAWSFCSLEKDSFCVVFVIVNIITISLIENSLQTDISRYDCECLLSKNLTIVSFVTMLMIAPFLSILFYFVKTFGIK